MPSTHRNSFCHYVHNFYTSVMGIPASNVLTFDLVKNGILTAAEVEKYSHCNIDLEIRNKPLESLTHQEVELRDVLEKVSRYCDDFEAKIANLGGIGFFLGGIGPDGHIAFNSPGSAHDSKTRLINFNYPTAAAAASDLGGIEVAKGKAAMTIGLGTITMKKKNGVVIIMAAGEGKAEVVRAAIEDPSDVSRPASVLHSFPGARFYITHGAAGKLTARRAEKVSKVTESVRLWALNHLSGTNSSLGVGNAHLAEPPENYTLIESFIYNASLQLRTPVHKLTLKMLSGVKEFSSMPHWFQDELSFNVMISCAARRLREKIEGGLKSSSPVACSILHTAPHHDDIMLSYHPAMHQMLGRKSVDTIRGGSLYKAPNQAGSSSSFSLLTVRDRGNSMNSNSMNQPSEVMRNANPAARRNMLGEANNDNMNHFAYLTSGFHSVNDSFLRKQIEAAASPNGTFGFLNSVVISGEMSRDYDELMTVFYDAFQLEDFEAQDRIESVIFLRKIAEVWQISLTQNYASITRLLKEKIIWLSEEYLKSHQPGDAVPKELQLLKGCMRESEVDRVWALSRMPMNRIHHMRSKFYTDDFFTPMPSLEDDALPMANLIRDRQPDLITVAFDPEGTGPDTHYKVLQVVAAGLRISIDRGDLVNPDPLIWGYRNVWFVFDPAEATLMVPGSAADLDLMHNTFMSCFTTQKAASFPSPHYDGPFSAWARNIQQEQRRMLGCLLGEEYFATHHDERVQSGAGFVFLKAMTASTFLREVEELKSKFEGITI